MSSPQTEQQQQQPNPNQRVLRPRPQDYTSQERIAELQRRINNTYEFKDDMTALEALQTGNLRQEIHSRLREVPNNKDLAILGDILLDMKLCIGWLPTGHTRKEFSDSQKRVVGNKNLDKIGRERKLDEIIIRDPNSPQPVGRDWMAATVEAIIGAVYKDAEMKRAGSGLKCAFEVAAQLGLQYDG